MLSLCLQDQHTVLCCAILRLTAVKDQLVTYDDSNKRVILVLRTLDNIYDFIHKLQVKNGRATNSYCSIDTRAE